VLSVEANLVLRAVGSPEDLRELTNPQWDLLLRLLWKCRLIGRVAQSCADAGITETLPEKVQQQFESAQVLIGKQRQLVAWEANRLGWALEQLEVPVVVLKGAAYMLSGFEFEQGRLFADLDIMVPTDELPRVEQRLKQQGWRFIELNSYDERYYRVWSHELPPMRHFEREVELDVHHTILPLTSRLTPDREKLWGRSQPLPGTPFRILAPEDMVLHSAVHLYHDGDLADAVRDILDLDGLMRLFSQKAGFWDTLIPRARELGLARPLFYALHFGHRFLKTPVPDDVMASAKHDAPSAPVRLVMDAIVPRALFPQNPDRSDATTAFARWLLYTKAHWLRMPPSILLPHLARKSLRRVTGRSSDH
jgi:hypothetical protein